MKKYDASQNEIKAQEASRQFSVSKRLASKLFVLNLIVNSNFKDPKYVEKDTKLDEET